LKENSVYGGVNENGRTEEGDWCCCNTKDSANNMIGSGKEDILTATVRSGRKRREKGRGRWIREEDSNAFRGVFGHDRKVVNWASQSAMRSGG